VLATSSRSLAQQPAILLLMSDMSESSDDSLYYVDRIEAKLKQLEQEQHNKHHYMTVADGALTEAAFWCSQSFIKDNWDELDRRNGASHPQSYLDDKRAIVEKLHDEYTNLTEEIDDLYQALDEAKAAGRWVCPDDSDEEDGSDEEEGEEDD
jgi:hypothetical protein